MMRMRVTSLFFQTDFQHGGATHEIRIAGYEICAAAALPLTNDPSEYSVIVYILLKQAALYIPKPWYGEDSALPNLQCQYNVCLRYEVIGI